MPAPLLAATLERATVREIHHPGAAPPEPQYRPSRVLADFVRCRDLTCRWPGCDKPASDCDIDHTVPWPVGPTHASNTKCYCRFHHLLKTFYGGWTDRQLPDGTEILAGYSPSRSVIYVSRGTNRHERSILCVSARPLVNRYTETRPDAQLFGGRGQCGRGNTVSTRWMWSRNSCM